jgi:GNAT superfamily N-acetyltransferase
VNSIEVRRPKIEDTAEMNQFFTKVIRDTFTVEGLTELQDDMRKEIEMKNRYLKCDFDSKGENRFFWIALDKKKIVGSIEYGPASELISNCTNGALKECVEIGTVFVHPDYQRRGIGTLLLNVMLLTLQARGSKEFCLDSGYTNAQKVWKKKFGEPDYLLKDYWGKGYHHMIWKRSTFETGIIFRN